MIEQELLAKAKQAKSVDELMTMAKESNYALTREQAEKTFANFHASGELSDDELDNVSGGCSVTIDGQKYKKVGNSDYCTEHYKRSNHILPDGGNSKTCESCAHRHPVPGKLLEQYCDIPE